MTPSTTLTTDHTKRDNGETDDGEILSLLLEKRKSLTSDVLNGVSSRFLSDAWFLSGDGGKPKTLGFWETLVDNACSNGFPIRCQEDDRSGNETVDINGDDDGFGSERGKAHVAAVCALLGVSPSRAISITRGAMRTSKTDWSSLLGTRALLLITRNFHYSQQIHRIRFVAEALRVDKQEPQEPQTLHLLRHFLHQIDATTTLTYSQNHISHPRGFFKIFLSLACAPTRTLHRRAAFLASALHTHTPTTPPTTVDLRSNNVSTFSQLPPHDFARHLMERHDTHHHEQLRTEALEALFALLYERIEGGVTRTDYVLLSTAFCEQRFFVDDAAVVKALTQSHRSNEDDNDIDNRMDVERTRRRSRLSALIMAESLALWQYDRTDTDTQHPFFQPPPLPPPPPTTPTTDASSSLLIQQLRYIGEQLLLDTLYEQAMQRRRTVFAADPNSASHDLVDAPEAIAMLTFGVLLKLESRRRVLTNPNQHEEQADIHNATFLKDLGFQCASVANDRLGAFAYLRDVADFPSSSSSCVRNDNGVFRSDSNDDGMNIRVFDWRSYAIQHCHDTKTPLLLGSEPHVPSDPQTASQDDNHHNTTDPLNVVYAGVTREILSGTLSAFRNSLLRHGAASDENDLGVFCDLASKIYRHAPVLRDSFWDEWERYREDRSAAAASGDGMEIVVADVPSASDYSLCRLLDAAEAVAGTALSVVVGGANHNDMGGGGGVRAVDGRRCASALPALAPLFRLVSSLLPRDNDEDARAVVSSFLPEDAAYVCLRGCSYLCTSDGGAETVMDGADGSAGEERERLVKAALAVMESLHVVARVMGSDRDGQNVRFMRAVLEPGGFGDSDVGGGSFVVSSPKLLCNIAHFGLHNVSFDKKDRTVLASSALGILTELLRCETESDFVWTSQVGQCLDQNSTNGAQAGFDLFVQSGMMEEVTAFSMSLLHKMAQNVTKFVIASTQENAVLNYLHTVEDGVGTACRLLPLTLDSSPERYRIALATISSIHIFLRAVLGIMEWHESDKLKSKARNIMGELIQTLASSDNLRGALGCYATLPVATGLCSVAQTEDEFIAASKDSVSDATWNGVSFGGGSMLPSLRKGRANGIKQEVYVSSLIQQVGKVPIPYQDDPAILRTVFKLAQMSMSLLLLWGEITERFAIEKHAESRACDSLLEVIDGFDVKTIQIIESDLQSNGPGRILLSCPVPPVTEITASYFWPAKQIPVLNLVTRYVGWCSEDDGRLSNTKTDLAIKSVKFMLMGMVHSNLSESRQKQAQIGTNNVFDSINPANIGSMGYQLQIAFIKLLENSPKDRESGECSQRRSALILHLLDVLNKSIVYFPKLAKHVLGGRDECKLVDLIVETLQPVSVSSPTTALIASSCADVLHQLWNSCRDNYAVTNESKSPVSLHPCDDVFPSLCSKNVVMKTCSSVLLNHRSIMGQARVSSLCHDEVSAENPSSLYVKSAIVNIISKALQIVGKETILFMQEDAQQSATASDMENLLKGVYDKDIIKKLYQAMNCFDGAIFSARSMKSVHDMGSSRYKFVTATWNNTPLAIEIIGDFPNEDEDQYLLNTLVTSHSAEYAVKLHASLISSLSQFGQIAALFDKEKTQLQSTQFRVIDQVMIPIRQSAENSFIAFSIAPSYRRRFIAAQTLNVAYELTGSLATHLSEISAPPPEEAQHLIGTLEHLLRSTERYITIVESPLGIQYQYEKYLVCRFRLNVLLSSLLLVDATKNIQNSNGLSQEEQKRFDGSRLGLCRLIGDTLNSLYFAGPYCDAREPEVGSGSVQFPYDFNYKISDSMNHHSTDIRGISLSLLRVTISLLSAVLPTTTKTPLSFSSNAYEVELAVTFRNCNMIPLVINHLDNASNVAASTYHIALDGASSSSNLTQNSYIHKNSVDMIARIFDFAYFLADSAGKDLPVLMLENRFVQSLTKCKILSIACQQWSALTKESDNTSQRERGYLKTKNITRFVQAKNISSMNYPHRKPDPVHTIWRSAIQILTALVRSCSSSSIGTLENLNKLCTSTVFDFISTFEDSILSCVQNCSFRQAQEAPFSEFGFTVNLLKEVCDILSLLSELCNEETRPQFKTFSPGFYHKVGLAALDIMKTLSTFMGAVGTARELFSILSNLKNSVAGDGNGGDQNAAIRHESFIEHPLMKDGVSNAKHEEIRNNLYASSCCVSMTDDEYDLSQSKTKSNAICSVDETASAMSLSQMCQNHLDNDFTLIIEGIVAQCVFNALSVIEKVHPASSCFIYFDENEAIRFNTSSSLPCGAIVAIRPNASTTNMSSYLCESDFNYGRITDYNSIKRTLDVHYFDTDKCNKVAMVEKEIPLLRLAGMEDISKKKCILDVFPAPNSVSDIANIGTSKCSLGDLIQVLRWCRHGDFIERKKDDIIDFQKELVKGIAESTAVMLGNEVAMHFELGSFACLSEDNMKELNRQLLVLFDNEQLDVSKTSTESRIDECGLKSFIGDDVWNGVLQQMDSLLTLGRVEREKIRKDLDESGAHLLSWGRTVQRGERRSPFKMTFKR